jgi:4-hydroxy-tetrahydrodipicolinate synthase
MFTGCGTALVTPFRKDLSLDEETLRKLVRRQIDAGIHFLVPCGTTGENPVLTRDERARVVAITVEEARGRNIPVVAGAGGYNTAEVIEQAREMERLGASGILSVAPYYNRPTQEGLYQHFKAIAEAVSLPVIMYNIPSRTGVNIEPATMARLAEIENIAGVKEASGSINQIANVIAATPERFTVFSGDDIMTIPVIALGGRGLICTTSNEIPAEFAQLVERCLKNDFAGARQIQRKYQALIQVNFIETNPIPVKAAMAQMGLLEPVWRLPLVPPRPETLAKICKVLESVGLAHEHVAG